MAPRPGLPPPTSDQPISPRPKRYLLQTPARPACLNLSIGRPQHLFKAGDDRINIVIEITSIIRSRSARSIKIEILRLLASHVLVQ